VKARERGRDGGGVRVEKKDGRGEKVTKDR
jgi:hypothetical protein